MNKVSIVIPVLNGRDYLRHALESVAAQDYGNIETVVCCSLDSTEDIGDIVSDFDVKVIPGGHGGTANWQAALNAASGDYVKLLCHDDEITPDCISRQVATLDSDPDLSLVFSSRLHINSYGEEIGVDRLQDTDRRVPGPFMIKFLLEHGNLIGESACALFRRHSITFPTNMNWLLDMYMWISALKVGDCFYQHEFLAKIRKHPAQDSYRCLADPDWEIKEQSDKKHLLALISA